MNVGAVIEQQLHYIEVAVVGSFMETFTSGCPTSATASWVISTRTRLSPAEGYTKYHGVYKVSCGAFGLFYCVCRQILIEELSIILKLF